jgi:CubicO group peptidase (beta-lactamase class C family)
MDFQVACLIAVDRGLISLDSESLIEAHLPELTGIQILEGYTQDGQEILRPATNKITLRMLLSHSAGEYACQRCSEVTRLHIYMELPSDSQMASGT